MREILVGAGWVWRDDTLYAPNATMWFSPAGLRDQMTEAGPDGTDQVALHADLVSLVAALDAVLDGN